MLDEALDIFRQAGLRPSGMTPPGWNAPDTLLSAMAASGLRYVASARDINTPISPGARAEMSGLRGVSLLYPQRLPSGLLHFATNFQATSTVERALEILRAGGLLAIKGHIIKNGLGYVMLDGIDRTYCNYLDLLLGRIEAEWGDRVWWTSMGQIAAHCESLRQSEAVVA